MKQILTPLLLVFLSVYALQAQSPVKDAELQGTWTIVKVEMPNILAADDKGVVFNEAFLNGLSDEDRPMTKGLLEGMMSAMVGSKAKFDKGSYTEINKKGKENKGTYTLAKSGKKLTLVLNGKKTDCQVEMQDGKLVLTQSSKQGEIKLIYEKL